MSQKTPSTFGLKSDVRKHHTMNHGHGLRTLQVTALGDFTMFSMNHSAGLGSQIGRGLWGERGPPRPLERNTKEEKDKPGECGVTGGKSTEDGRRTEHSAADSPRNV